MPNIHLQIFIAATAEKVFEALTTQEGLSAWWTPNTAAVPKEQTIARFTFGNGYYKEMEIVKLKPHHLVEWLCVYGADEWIGTDISFTIKSGTKEKLLAEHPELGDQLHQSSAGSGSLLIFHHNNWKEYTSLFAECSYTWGRFLRSLKLYCEKGEGTPWPTQHAAS
jgi:hypothetical protein